MQGWIRACATDDVEPEDMIRLEVDGHIFAIVRSPDGSFHCTSGMCTHEAVDLTDGLVFGNVIECPRHNGQFDYRTGQAKRPPACDHLQTFPVKVEDGTVFVSIKVT